jgi:hypothetical protein
MSNEKITKLTPEQEANIEVFSEKWLDFVFKYQLYEENKKISHEEKTKRIGDLYEALEYKRPLVIQCTSPRQMQKFANVLENDKYDKLFRKDIDDKNHVEFLNKLNDIIANDNINFTYKNFSYSISSYEFSWLGYYDYINENFKNILDDELKQRLKLLVNASKLSFMSIQYEEVCLICEFPRFISRNASFQLHNINGPSVIFEDYELYAINGLIVTAELYKSLSEKTYLFSDFVKEQNEEIKSAVLNFYEEKFGGTFLVDYLKEYLSEKDTYVDTKDPVYLEGTTKSMNVGVYTLFKGQIEDVEIAYVRCFCPSTDRMFFLGVFSEHNNAKDAIASLCRIPRKLKKHLTSLQRQGEIFSANFTPKGTEILKNLSQSEKDDLVSLSGNEYFGLMKYEY